MGDGSGASKKVQNLGAAQENLHWSWRAPTRRPTQWRKLHRMKFPAFGRTKVQKIETTIASLVKRADQLAAKRAKAQKALETATSARQQALLAGDLDDQKALDKLQAAVDSATSALTGIDDALAIIAQQKADAE